VLNVQHFAKAPITEAILDIQFDPIEGVGIESLNSVFSDYLEYGSPKPQMLAQATFNFGGSNVPDLIEPKQIGALFTHTNQKQIARVGLQSFTYSQIAPYETWEKFSAEAKIMWTAYKKVVPVAGITRIALRYINRIDLPWPFADLNEYFTTYPQVSLGLPQQLSGFFMRLDIPLDTPGVNLILQQALTPPSGPDLVSVLLDIDVFQATNLPVDDELWASFSKLHEYKNVAFFSCITDKAKELFN
jgi:uncharacterized protein (TIGR04255 family)